MEINIIAFGKIADLIASRNCKVADVQSTEALRAKLENDFPNLRGMSYLIAVNKQIATLDTPLTAGAEVALLPPFSGG